MLFTQNNSEQSDVLTVAELAAMLRVHPVTVRLAAAAGKIPGKQIGNRWRFCRAVINSWLAKGEATHG